ncbi:MAG: hypothetical protein KC731_33940, partial [Myxococcales bacterium]|nr:hypothetical protein [Myxococcales bacterium]
ETVKAKLATELFFPPSKLTLEGQLDIAGCGLMPWTTKAKVVPQPDLRVTLAEQPISINGATLETSPEGRVLRLNTEPQPCGANSGSDLSFTITLPPEGPPGGPPEGKRGPSELRAQGYRLPRTLTAKPEAGALTVEIATTPESATAVLSGNIDLGGYGLRIDGKASLVPCPAS